MGKKYADDKVDYRVIKLNIARGVISHEEYEEFLKTLPDLKDQLEEIPAYTDPEEDSQHDSSSGGLTFTVG